MTEYRFYDTDDYGQAEYDITGDHYLTLIESCFKYCSVFCLRIHDDRTVLPSELEKYRVDFDENFSNAYKHYFNSDIRCYRVCDETKKLFLTIADSIFKWIYAWGYTNPEDPAFFRSDGSIFFYSVIHEGECILLPRDCENVCDILSYGNWENTKNTGDG